MYPDYKKIVFPYTNKDCSITWVVEFPDLPGCSAVGRTEEEALQESKVARELWLDEYFDQHQSYPEPKRTANNFSGKILVRLPKTLHKELAEEAEEECVSLNQLIVALLAQNFGKRLSQPTFNITVNRPSHDTEIEARGIEYKSNGSGNILRLPSAI